MSDRRSAQGPTARPGAPSPRAAIPERCDARFRAARCRPQRSHTPASGHASDRHWRPTSLKSALLGGDADGGPSLAFAETAVQPGAGVALPVGSVTRAVAVGQVIAPFAVEAAAVG